MYFNIDDPECKNYAVYLDGKIEKLAVEADEEKGWVCTKKPAEYGWFVNTKPKKERKYGRVHIVKMEDIDIKEYRHRSLR